MIEGSPKQAVGNLNAMNFYIRSLDPAASCWEYARYPFISDSLPPSGYL